MDCGADDLACVLLDWFFAHAYFLKEPLEYVASTWDRTGGTITEFLKQHGEKIVAMASFSFAVWRWWLYREKVLHKRLDEYIQESDERLGPASTAAIDAILKPAPTPALSQPAFAIELKRFLATTDWQPATRHGSPRIGANSELSAATAGVLRRAKTAERAWESLQQQRAQAHLLKGVVAATRARRCSDPTEAKKLNRRALREFQFVQHLPGQQRSIPAKEGEANQYFRLGERDKALRAYEELEGLAGDLIDNRENDTLVARSKRFRTQIKLAQNYPGVAWRLVAVDGDPTTAFALRSRHGGYVEWETIEQAETHYVAARAAKANNFVWQEQYHLSEAKQNYDTALEAIKRHWMIPKRIVALKEEAEAGLVRVEQAMKGTYDDHWLMLT